MAKATHVTDRGTQKYQCNGPSEWAPFFKDIAEKIGGKGTAAGVGIRAVLAAAFASRTSAQLAAGATAAGVTVTTGIVAKPAKAPARVVKGADVKAAAKAAAKGGDQ